MVHVVAGHGACVRVLEEQVGVVPQTANGVPRAVGPEPVRLACPDPGYVAAVPSVAPWFEIVAYLGAVGAE